jgi:hypothetical protein
MNWNTLYMHGGFLRFISLHPGDEISPEAFPDERFSVDEILE